GDQSALLEPQSLDINKRLTKLSPQPRRKFPVRCDPLERPDLHFKLAVVSRPSIEEAVECKLFPQFPRSDESTDALDSIEHARIDQLVNGATNRDATNPKALGKLYVRENKIA